jgi:deoxyribodipyrimidine photo-lyase
VKLPISQRVRNANAAPVRSDRSYVLYWMIATRRPSYNFALDRAHAWARALDRPLVILEPLRVDYPFASDRFHRFIIDGMASNAAAFRRTPVLYHPYVEPAPGAGKGLLVRLAADAAVVVTDDYPCFFLPQAVASAAAQLSVAMEAVDSNGVLPLAGTDRAFTAASHFRRYLQKGLRDALKLCPSGTTVLSIAAAYARRAAIDGHTAMAGGSSVTTGGQSVRPRGAADRPHRSRGRAAWRLGRSR